MTPVIFAFTRTDLKRLASESIAPVNVEFVNHAPDRFDRERFAKATCALAILAFEKSDDFNATCDKLAPVKSIL